MVIRSLLVWVIYPLVIETFLIWLIYPLIILSDLWVVRSLITGMSRKEQDLKVLCSIIHKEVK